MSVGTKILKDMFMSDSEEGSINKEELFNFLGLLAKKVDELSQRVEELENKVTKNKK